MKREAEIKELLISNAIKLIAKGGFEMATTQELTHYGGDLPDIKMNEVYIYRIFGSKEELFREVFKFLDNELYEAFEKGFNSLKDADVSPKEKIIKFLEGAWRFVLKNEDRCRCYVRYYYSIYFKGESSEYHKKLFKGVISEMAPAFKDEADVGAILHSVFTALFDFAIRVYNGDLEDNEINRPHIFNVLYCMMETYFKASEATA